MTVTKFKNKIINPIGDLLLGKLMSKKLTIMIIATVALFNGFLDGDNFTWITMIYIGVEGGYNVAKAYTDLKKGNQSGITSENPYKKTEGPHSGNEDD